MVGNPARRGGCLCGQVRYEGTGTPRDSCICFCKSCRLADQQRWLAIRNRVGHLPLDGRDGVGARGRDGLRRLPECASAMWPY